MSNISTCHDCLRAHGAACAGPCPCPADVAAAQTDSSVVVQDILIRARDGTCRLKKFTETERAPTQSLTANAVAKPLEHQADPYSEWPWYFKLLRHIQGEQQRGIGDTIKMLADYSGTDSAIKITIFWLRQGLKHSPGLLLTPVFQDVDALLAKGCGCENRRIRLNHRYPYDGKDGRPSPKP